MQSTFHTLLSRKKKISIYVRVITKGLKIMAMCMQCNSYIVCSKNKNHAYNSQTVVIFINRIQSVKIHKKYIKLTHEYRKRGCKLLFIDDDELHRVNNRKKKVYRKIKTAIIRAGVHVSNVIIYFWENEKSFEYNSLRSLHPNTILGDLSSIKCLANKFRWFLISTRITSRRRLNPLPKKKFGIAVMNMGYLDINVNNEEECIHILEKMKYWDRLEDLVKTCRQICRLQHGGPLVSHYIVL